MLLDGRYFDARRQFNFALERLDDVDERDRKTLAAEIAMANSIIGSGPATEAFQRAIAQQAASAPATDANVNANTTSPDANTQLVPQP
jgi:hypothetical protein